MSVLLIKVFKVINGNLGEMSLQVTPHLRLTGGNARPTQLRDAIGSVLDWAVLCVCHGIAPDKNVWSSRHVSSDSHLYLLWT